MNTPEEGVDYTCKKAWGDFYVYYTIGDTHFEGNNGINLGNCFFEATDKLPKKITVKPNKHYGEIQQELHL